MIADGAGTMLRLSNRALTIVPAGKMRRFSVARGKQRRAEADTMLSSLDERCAPVLVATNSPEL